MIRAREGALAQQERQGRTHRSRQSKLRTPPDGESRTTSSCHSELGTGDWGRFCACASLSFSLGLILARASVGPARRASVFSSPIFLLSHGPQLHVIWQVQAWSTRMKCCIRVSAPARHDEQSRSSDERDPVHGKLCHRIEHGDCCLAAMSLSRQR